LKYCSLRSTRLLGALAAVSWLLPAIAAAAEPDSIRFATLPGNPQLGPDIGCVRVQGNGVPNPTERFQAIGFTSGQNGIPEAGLGDDVSLGPVAATYSWRLVQHHARYAITDPSEVGTIDPVTGVFTAAAGLPTGRGIVTATTPGGMTAEATIFILPPDFVADPPSRVHHISCEMQERAVRLDWIPGAAYLGQKVYRDKTLVGTLPGDAVSFADAGVDPGPHLYEVVGSAMDGGHEMDSDPTPCLIVVNRPPTTHLLWAPVEQEKGKTDSAAAICEALLANGERVFEVKEITGVNLKDFRAVWAIFGTYPDVHNVWLSETQWLAKYLTEDGGRLYIEGADIWGAVPLNAFLEVDGVFHCDPDDILCVGIPPGSVFIEVQGMYGANAGNGLDLSSFTGPLPYTGESNFIDHLMPGPTGAGAFWINSNPMDPFALGIAYKGPGYRTIECSFEFGGIDGDRTEIMRRYLEFLDAGTLGLRFSRGDVDASGKVDLSDAIRTLSFLFQGGSVRDCLDAADVNDDGAVDITDPIRTLSFLFLGDSQPEAPYPSCGLDPTEDPFACFEHAPACP
jgi:hypothetical protein